MNAARPRPIRIIGGGWAGLAAAIELTHAGRRVEIFEAAPMLGGRARGLDWHGIDIDNGPHLMLGAYHETLRLIELIGAHSSLDRRRLRLIGPDLDLSLPYLPAPFHLAAGLFRASGLSWHEKWAAARLVQGLKRHGWRLTHDAPLADWLHAQAQPERLIRRLWQPLALAALNTPIAIASAQTFVTVLRDSLGGPRAASDAIFTHGNLATAFTEPARRWLTAHGSVVHTGQRIKTLADTPNDITLIATSPVEAARLLEGHRAWTPLHAQLNHLRYQPIVSLWLAFAAPLALTPNYPIQALGDADMPWLFDRQTPTQHLISLTASGDGAHCALDNAALLKTWLALLSQRIGHMGHMGPLPALQRHLVIREQRATFAATPDRPRFSHKTALPSLWLAGDYTHPEYPATLEGAVQSGVQCAREILHTTS
ncbi:MAG: FAD-binding protein [Betaproteobacteria bacterium]|nr:MAG: FAD-binding protein [Betaproteobacteria bacterium]